MPATSNPKSGTSPRPYYIECVDQILGTKKNKLGLGPKTETDTETIARQHLGVIIARQLLQK